MDVNFHLKEKEIHKIYKKYLLSKNKKAQYKKGNPVGLESLGNATINLNIEETALFLSYEGISIEIKFNRINNIEKFQEFIVIENTIVDLVVPIDAFKPAENINLFLEELRTKLNYFRYGEFTYNKEGYEYTSKDSIDSFLDNNLYDENKNLKDKKSVIVSINDKSKVNIIVWMSLLVIVLIIVGVATISYVNYESQENNQSKNSIVRSSSNAEKNHSMSNNSNIGNKSMTGNMKAMGFINSSNENTNDNTLFTKDYDYKTINAEAKKYYRDSINIVKNSQGLFHLMTREEGRQFINDSYNGVNLKGNYEKNAIIYFDESVELGLKSETMSTFQNDMKDRERGIAQLSQMNPGIVYNSIESMALDTAALDNMMESCFGYSAKNVIAELDNEFPREAVINYINKKNLLVVPKGFETEFYMGPVEMTSENELYRTILVNEITLNDKNVVQSRLYEVYEDGSIKSIG